MTTIRYKQYQPISTVERAADAALTVRQVHDLARSINNYNAWVAAFKGMQIWSPQQSTARMQSHLGVTDERVIAVGAPVRYSEGPELFVVRAGLRRIAGAGTTTWKVYANGFFYAATPAIDTGLLSPDYAATSLTCNSDDHQRPVTQDLPIVRGRDGLTWFLVTATNSDGTTQSVVTTLDLWPEYNWATSGVVAS